ncbi:hypothetical protein AA0121_g6368 [Alternaria tenuissima]|nr:hypothetical protein AA0121_g6368 [Alternaria tenuissima]
MAPRRSTRKSTGIANDVATAPSPASATALVDSPMDDSRHKQKRTRASRSFVPNSSDHETDTIEVEAPQKSANSRRVLKEVLIPTKSKKAPATRGRLAGLNAEQAEQESSTGSPSLENSDYETPGTSISTTPAASVNRGKMPARSRLNKATTPSQSASSKRSRSAVLDSDSEDMTLDMDAEIALQMQLEDEEDAPHSKRQKIETDEDEDMLSEDEPVAPSRRKKAPAYVGKGKGKAKVEEILSDDDRDSLVDELSSPPSYKGKGKGKAHASSTKRGRSARSSAKKKGTFTEEDFLDDDESDG